MRKKAIVLLLVVALTLWALPTLALAEDSSGVVGETAASVNFEEEIAGAGARAAFSDVPEPDEAVGTVGAAAGESNSGPGGSVNVDNGGGSETTSENSFTYARAGVGEDELTQAVERVDNLEITAPDGLFLGTGVPLEKLVVTDQSYGNSQIYKQQPVPDFSDSPLPIKAYTFHTIGEEEAVELFDMTIRFENGYVYAYTDYNSDAGDLFNAYAEASLENLEVWDPTVSGYQSFGGGNFSNSTAFLTDFSAILADYNAILALSNLEILNFLEVTANDNDGDGPARARALLMRVVLYDSLTGDPLIVLALADVWSHFDADSASTGGKEVDFFASPPTTPPKQEEQPKPTEPTPTEPTEPTPTVTAPQPEIQPVPEVQPQPAQPQAQPVQVAQAQPQAEQLPVTGFNYLWLLLGVGLILTGLRLRRI